MRSKFKEYISRKDKGFTLVEMIAVLAIIVILFSVFTPKVAGYIKEAKKTKALEEVRQVVLAIDTYNIKSSTVVGVEDNYDSIKRKLGSNDFIDFNSIKSIDDSMRYKNMKELLGGGSFTLNDKGIISYT